MAQTISRTRSDSLWRTRLTGNWLLIIRIVWLAVAGLVIGLTILAIPAFYDHLLTTVPQTEMVTARLYAEDVSALDDLGISLEAYALYLTGLRSLLAIISSSIALLIFWRRSDDSMAFMTSIFLLLWGLTSAIYPLVRGLSAGDAGWRLPTDAIISIGYGIILCYLYIFPDGRFVPRWTSMIVLGWSVWLGYSALAPDSPLSVHHWDTLTFILICGSLYGHGLYTAVQRYRRSSSQTQRQQIKWVVYGFVVAYAGVIGVPATLGIAFPSVLGPGLDHALYNIGYETIFVPSLAIIPVTMALSILRYRLWDVDVVINRSLVYGGLTAVLGAVFVGSVLIFQRIFQMFTGEMQSPLVLAVSAVMIGALFQPARRNLRHFVNRRIYHLAIDPGEIHSEPSDTSRPGMLAGTMLGNYQVLEAIGHGGMGEVYRGYQPGLNRPVAIKVLHFDKVNDAEYRLRFEREAKTVAALNHPHIINVFDYGQSNGLYYMVMDYIGGRVLRDEIKEKGLLPMDQILGIINDLADALDYAHANALVHRDVKASNVVLREQSGHPVLMDFGIAKIRNAHTGLTRTDGIVGSLDYLSPEQITASRDVDHRADVYALGVVLFQMLTGELPFAENNPAQIIFGHLYKPAPDPRIIIPDLPDDVAAVVLKALAKSPDDRFQSAGELAQALSDAVYMAMPAAV